MVLRNKLDNDLWTLNTSCGIQHVRQSKNNDTYYLINDFCKKANISIKANIKQSCI